jgi:hypothetical protein
LPHHWQGDFLFLHRSPVGRAARIARLTIVRRGVLVACAALLLAAVPAAGQASGDPVAAAVAWLHTQQQADGGFGGPSTTADTVYVIGLLGQDPDGPAWTVNGISSLDAMAAKAPAWLARNDAGQAGKVARAVALAGGDPRAFAGMDLVAIIEKAYDPSTGRYHPDWLYRHTLAIEGLARAGRPVPQDALRALLAAQLPDGSWAWSFASPQGDVDSTGRVLALLAGEPSTRCAPALHRAAAHLDAMQLSSGGWPDLAAKQEANANSTALAVGGLVTLGEDVQGDRFRPASAGALDALLSFQEPTGAFRYMSGQPESRLMATLDALVALVQPAGEAPVCKARYLPLLVRF